MNKQDQASWDELVEGAKSVNLDHVPQKAIEALFADFIRDVTVEQGARRGTPPTILSGVTWALAGALYLVALIALKHF